MFALHLTLTRFRPHRPATEKAMCPMLSSRKKMPFRLLMITLTTRLESAAARKVAHSSTGAYNHYPVYERRTAAGCAAVVRYLGRSLGGVDRR